MPQFTCEIDPIYVLSEPPELTQHIASARWKELNILLHSMALLGDEMERDQPLLPLLRTAASIASSDRGLLYRWNDVRSDVMVSASLGWPSDTPGEPQGATIQAHASLLHRKPVLVFDPMEHELRHELVRTGCRAALSVPMVRQGLPWGVLQLLRDRPFLREEAVLLWMFSLVLEGTLPMMIGHRLAAGPEQETDTGSRMLAPGHFRRRLSWELQRAAWRAEPLTVLCIKVIEPLHGRPRGDNLPFAPRQSAAIIKQALRLQDFVTCLGGHHFVIALPDTTCDAALQMEDQVRESLMEVSSGTLASFEIRTGLARFPEDGTNEADLMRTACSTARFSRNPLSG